MDSQFATISLKGFFLESILLHLIVPFKALSLVSCDFLIIINRKSEIDFTSIKNSN